LRFFFSSIVVSVSGLQDILIGILCECTLFSFSHLLCIYCFYKFNCIVNKVLCKRPPWLLTGSHFSLSIGHYVKEESTFSCHAGHFSQSNFLPNVVDLKFNIFIFQLGISDHCDECNQGDPKISAKATSHQVICHQE